MIRLLESAEEGVLAVNRENGGFFRYTDGNRKQEKEPMSDDIFDFDIDAELEQAEKRAQQKAQETPAELQDESDCDGCKI